MTTPSPVAADAVAAFSRALEHLQQHTAAPTVLVIAIPEVQALMEAVLQSVSNTATVIYHDPSAAFPSEPAIHDMLIVTRGNAVPKLALFANTTILLYDQRGDAPGLIQVRRRMRGPFPSVILALLGMLPFTGTLLQRYGPGRVWNVIKVQTQGQWQDFSDNVEKWYTTARNTILFATTTVRLRLRRPVKKEFPYEDHSSYR